MKDWLKTKLESGDRRSIGHDIKTAELGWPLGMPLVRSLKDGLWEIRTTLSGGKTARIMFCAHDGEMVLLHGFVKKTNKTPSTEMDIARRRMKEVKNG